MAALVTLGFDPTYPSLDHWDSSWISNRVVYKMHDDAVTNAKDDESRSQIHHALVIIGKDRHSTLMTILGTSKQTISVVYDPYLLGE